MTTKRQLLTLTERVTTTHKIDFKDVEYLLYAHCNHVDIRPTYERGHYQLTPRGYVGSFVTPNLHIHIEAKIGQANLFHLIDDRAPVRSGEASQTMAPGTALRNFLAECLAQRLHERIETGLQRDYVERAEHSAFLQGRLDMAEQMRSGRKDRLACRFEEFTVDTPIHQVLKSTLDMVLPWPELTDSVRQSLMQARSAFADVSSISLHPQSFANIKLNGLTADYAPLLELCRLLAVCLNPTNNPGSMPGPCFLLNLEQVFERYITRHFTAHVRTLTDKSLTLMSQRDVVPHESQPGQTDWHMRPDLTLHREGMPIWVADVKWKRSPFVRTDLHQILAYCAALGCRYGVLIYPGSRTQHWDYAFRTGGVNIRIQQVKVTGKVSAMEKSLRSVMRQTHADHWQRQKD